MDMPFNVPPNKMPVGFSLEDFIFSKLYKCIHHEGQKTMCEVFQAMYLHTFSDKTKTVKEFVKKSMGLSSAQFKTTFTKLDKEQLDFNIMTLKMDITILCKLVLKGFPNIYNLDSNCQDQIINLRMQRNTISHKYKSDKLDIAAEVDKLKIIYRNIYEGVGVALGKDFSENIREREKALDDIRDAQIRQDDMETYKEDIKKFKDDNLHKLIWNGRKELETLWMTHTSESSFSRINVGKKFSPLKIKDLKKDIAVEELLTVKTDPCAVILFGLAGTVKTLCQYIVSNWCDPDNNIITDLKNFDLVFLFEVQTVKSCSLKRHLAEQLIVQTSREFELSKLITFLQELNILFIIDGFHEANEVSKELLGEVFEKFGNQHILLTTTPDYLTNAILLSNEHNVDYLAVEMFGFD
ncbi:uncharacterized protein [Procambarus clarkii]|uniref:uncharacterized protein n=1 Tax=Procambarus clarkii TaxID=6728 RepID=UPI0037441DC6